MVAPSLVTVIVSDLGPAEKGFNILSIPFGPIVVLTKSPTAIAPTNTEILAISPLYSEASFFKTLGKTFPTISIFLCAQ